MFTNIPLNITTQKFHNLLEPFQNQNQNQNVGNNVIVKDDQFVFPNSNKRLTRVCPHNGCLFNYNKEAQQFVCPCHASKFNLEGTCLEGPACPKSIKL